MPDRFLSVPQMTASRSWVMDGGGRRYANWHSTENDPSARASDLARYLISIRAEPHLVWNPWTGEIVQLVPADRGGSVLLAGNHLGSTNIGCECIGRAGVEGMRPLIDSPMIGFGKILAWMQSWGIPDAWPAGAPLPYPAAAGFGNPQRKLWGPSGHYSHSQWPANDHGDPGLVNLNNFLAGHGAADPGTPTAEAVMAILEGLNLNNPVTEMGWNALKLDVLQLLLAQSGMWIVPNELLAVPPRTPDARYTNLRGALGGFQNATRTGRADGTPDLIIGPMTAAALCEQKKRT